MFTGLVREKAIVKSFSQSILTLKANYRPKIGDSIAVNGACLTVTSQTETTFDVLLSPETKAQIAYENLKSRVHIEPAMQANDRLDGHFVQGHIDGIGEVVDLKKDGTALNMLIKIPKHLMPLMIPKGSVAIDGISLTINAVLEESIRLTLIPHTLKETLLGEYYLKRRVNIESDMIVRSLYHMLQRTTKKTPTWEEVEHWMHLY
ncbi:MAG: riboflavin synthase [Campylobacteraceae bacterium]|nr:riboflavin synthase [Campylobacteraceae bacterium]